jgi:hypothetical protein
VTAKSVPAFDVLQKVEAVHAKKQQLGARPDNPHERLEANDGRPMSRSRVGVTNGARVPAWTAAAHRGGK